MACIRVCQDAICRVKMPVEQSRELILRPGLKGSAVEFLEESGNVRSAARRQGLQPGVEASHQEGRADSFAGYIGEHHTDPVPLKAYEIIVVAADPDGLGARPGVVETLERLL